VAGADHFGCVVAAVHEHNAGGDAVKREVAQHVDRVLDSVHHDIDVGFPAEQLVAVGDRRFAFVRVPLGTPAIFDTNRPFKLRELALDNNRVAVALALGKSAAER
jgi:hypothetical protein